MRLDERPDLLDWLGLRWEPDFSNAKWLGKLLSGAFALLVLFLVVPTLIEFVKAVTGLDRFADDEAQSTAIRNTGLVLAAVVGVPFVVWRSVVAQKQVNIAEQGHITERIGQAVDQLGHENIAVRMGAIHSLERVMLDSASDRVMVMRTLNAYLNHRQTELPPEEPGTIPETPIDIQAALDVILRWSME